MFKNSLTFSSVARKREMEMHDGATIKHSNNDLQVACFCDLRVDKYFRQDVHCGKIQYAWEHPCAQL